MGSNCGCGYGGAGHRTSESRPYIQPPVVQRWTDAAELVLSRIFSLRMERAIRRVGQCVCLWRDQSEDTLLDDAKLNEPLSSCRPQSRSISSCPIAVKEAQGAAINPGILVAYVR